MTFGADSSGKSRMRKPLSSWYSVIPSMVTIFFGRSAAPAKPGKGASGARLRESTATIACDAGCSLAIHVGSSNLPINNGIDASIVSSAPFAAASIAKEIVRP